MQVIRDKQKKKGAGVLQSIAVVSLMGMSALGLAYVWQNYQEAAGVEYSTAEPSGAQSGVRDPGGAAVPDEPVRQPEHQPEEPQEDQRALAGEDDTSEMQVPGETTGARPSPAPVAVPESGRVDNTYFEDAIFFGDSISTGIPLYKVGGNPDTVAYSGINPGNVGTKEVIDTPDGKVTLLEAAKQYGEKNKVYIMLGSNGLWMNESSFAEGYDEFVRAVKEQYPGATIYLQSIFPVTDYAKEKYEAADNETIRRFNELVQGIARQNGVYYLDVAQAVMDENGELPAEASPLDGVHLTPEYYARWFEYLKTHTVEGGR